MSQPTSPVLEQLRSATATPSWIQRAYTTETNHTHVLVSALNSNKQQDARRLAAALWNLASEAKIEAEKITKITARPEYALTKGKHSIVDLLVELEVGGETRRLAVEVKVDGMPYGSQLLSMADALGNSADRRLVLLCLGAAQASRIEPDSDRLPDIRRWAVPDMLGISDLVIAASPVPADAQAWLDELGREEQRRQAAWTDEQMLAGCGYRPRLLLAYRYREAAKLLGTSGSTWEVSLQPHGVVLHGKSSHYEVPGTSVTLYLEVADRKLKVKAGAWYDDSDARAAAEPLIPRMSEVLLAQDFKVKLSKRTPGSSVTVLSIDPDADDWPLDAFVDRLKRAHAAWKSLLSPA